LQGHEAPGQGLVTRCPDVEEINDPFHKGILTCKLAVSPSVIDIPTVRSRRMDPDPGGAVAATLSAPAPHR
jgi:hypothetical protein